MSSSIFAGVEQGPAIEVFALNRAFQEDSNPKKANLGVGGKFLVHNLLHCMPCGLCNLLSSPCKSILLHFVRMYAFSSSISPPTPHSFSNTLFGHLTKNKNLKQQLNTLTYTIV